MSTSTIHPTAEVADDVEIGVGSSIWQLVHIREGVRIGADCVIGRGVYIGPGVRVGRRTKIQNSALVYDPADIGDGVFIGPGVVLTNDVYPRSVAPDGTLKRAAEWESDGVVVGNGASVGASSVVLAGVHIGEWALVGAGSTVIRDVPANALVVGNPARQIGWVGRTGERLTSGPDGHITCPETGDVFLDLGDRIELVKA